MKPEVVNVSGKECHVYVRPQSKYLLIQPVDEHDLELLDREVELVEALSGESFSLVAFRIEDWNRELTPWTAPPVFGKEPFGNGAEETLAFVTGHLLPMLREKETDASHCLLGGYSLAGLFAFWAAYQTDKFAGIAAASPSIWFPGFVDYMKSHAIRCSNIYLSLGDKEEKTRNAVMSQVGDCIRDGYAWLKEHGIYCTLEWNKGGHFKEPELRTARAFARLLK
jgi:predicted alpha/beta superfamily hydrolase